MTLVSNAHSDAQHGVDHLASEGIYHARFWKPTCRVVRLVFPARMQNLLHLGQQEGLVELAVATKAYWMHLI